MITKALRKRGIPVIIGICILFSSCNKPVHHDVVISHVNVINVKTGEILEDRTIAIDNNRITAIYQNVIQYDDSTLVVNATDKYIIPGLCDSHTHISSLTTTGIDTLKAELADFVHRGVLYLRDVGGPVDIMNKLKNQISSGELIGPDIYFTGPMLESSPLYWEKYNEVFPGLTVPLDSKIDVDSLLPILAKKGAVLIKTFNNIKPELYPYIVEIAKQNKLKVVHDPGRPILNWVPIEMALEYGVTSFEHATAPWHYLIKDEYRAELETVNRPDANPQQQMDFLLKMRKLGIESISEQRLEDLSNLMKEKNAVLCPTLYVYRTELNELEEEEAKKEGNEEIINMLLRIKSTIATVDSIVDLLSAHGVKLLVGQDNVKPEGTAEEMILLSKAGVKNEEVLKGATLYAAEWLGIADKYGSIEQGKMADLVILNGDPIADIANIKDVYQVIQHGKIIK